MLHPWRRRAPGHHAASETDRLEAFSDGVMAVIITIMAFSIPTPGAVRLRPSTVSSPICSSTS